MDRESDLPLTARRVAQVRRAIVRQRQRIMMLEAAGCSTRNAQQTLEVLVRTVGILERRKHELRTKGRPSSGSKACRLGLVQPHSSIDSSPLSVNDVIDPRGRCHGIGSVAAEPWS